MAKKILKSKATADRCTLRIEVNNVWASSWIFSPKGYLLTVGHIFEENNCEIGDKFTVNFLDGTNFISELLEFAYNKDKALDYAILKLPKRTSFYPFVPITIDDTWKKYGSEECTIFGYPEHSEQYLMPLKAEFEGKVPIRGAVKDYFIKMRIPPEDIRGMSGGAVCVDGENTKAIAIQTHQHKTNKHISLAVPLKKIICCSVLANRIYSEQKMHSKLNIFSLPPELLLQKKKLIGPQKRYILILLPFTAADPEAEKICNMLCNNWEFRLQEINRRLDRIHWFKTKRPEIKFEPEPKPISNNDIEEKNVLSLIRVEFEGGYYFGIRCVVDLTGRFSDDNNGEIEGNVSHLVEIKAKQDKTMLDDKSGFDLKILLNSGESQTVEEIFNIIEDIYLDINVFYSITPLKELFNNTSEKRAFSMAKVSFLKSISEKAYGFDIGQLNLEYVSLAACCRKKIGDDINFNKYKRLWEQFINEWLFNPLELSTRNNVPSIDINKAVQRILSLEGLGNQLSEKKMRAKLGKLDFLSGEYIFFAVSSRKPRKKSVRKDLAIQLGYCNYRSNQFNFFKRSTIHSILKYIQYVRIYIFKLK